MKIAKSQTWPRFEVDVAAHALEMKNWRAHMARVTSDENNGVTGADRHVAHPRPMVHPLVASAVNENDESCFEIIDDGPSPSQRMTAKKNELLQLVSASELQAISDVDALAKRRLRSMREQDILAGVRNPSIMDKVKSVVGIATPALLPEDQTFLDEQSERRAKVAAISRIAAQAHHDIDDLTLDNIDAWQLPNFTD